MNLQSIGDWFFLCFYCPISHGGPLCSFLHHEIATVMITETTVFNMFSRNSISKRKAMCCTLGRFWKHLELTIVGTSWRNPVSLKSGVLKLKPSIRSTAGRSGGWLWYQRNSEFHSPQNSWIRYFGSPCEGNLILLSSISALGCRNSICNILNFFVENGLSSIELSFNLGRLLVGSWLHCRQHLPCSVIFWFRVLT